MPSSWTRLAGASVAALALWQASAAGAAPSAPDLERRVKAAFLYKFSGYVEWPTASFPRLDTPIEIGIAGDGPLASELAQMVIGRTTAGRPIAVTRRDPDDRPERLHILFIARSEMPRLKEWVESTGSTPVLIVTESEGALDRGSMINFVLSEGRVRFEVALGAAQNRGLRLSSGLLAVAKAVTTGLP